MRTIAHMLLWIALMFTVVAVVQLYLRAFRNFPPGAEAIPIVPYAVGTAVLPSLSQS